MTSIHEQMNVPMPPTISEWAISEALQCPTSEMSIHPDVVIHLVRRGDYQEERVSHAYELLGKERTESLRLKDAVIISGILCGLVGALSMLAVQQFI